jgi:hypothetical protein
MIRPENLSNPQIGKTDYKMYHRNAIIIFDILFQSTIGLIPFMLASPAQNVASKMEEPIFHAKYQLKKERSKFETSI